MLIGLSGYAGSGKDAAASFLIKEHGYERRAFADSLKAIATDLGWDGKKDDKSQDWWPRLGRRLGLWGHRSRLLSGRRLLQALGPSVRKNIGLDSWITPVLTDMPELLVITDVRYKNEAAAVKAAGGYLVRLTRPGVDAANEHISETDLDMTQFDCFLDNSASLECLGEKVERMLLELSSLD